MCDSEQETSPVLLKSDRALVHELEAAAVEQWDDEYAINIRRWSDGTAQIYAEHLLGLTPDGHRKMERLMPDGEDNFGIDFVVETRSETKRSEVIEYPVNGTSVTNNE
ncbi:hypothetical protein [Halegenticoccus soli]|uniref:hypothetical protein n=1 Tax=Halegenticoccus soli TaxID=1985678 RepID=UPI000C6E97F1|nr:hypothetical protein [Halegenticoccus soli]